MQKQPALQVFRAPWALLLALAVPLEAQQSPCFPLENDPRWTGEDIGLAVAGSSRPAGPNTNGGFELCSVSRGLDLLFDSVRFLFQHTRANFEIVTQVERIDETGLAGVMARWNARTVDSSYAAVAIHQSPNLGAVLLSSFRTDSGLEAHLGESQPMPVQLPLFVRLKREGMVLTTSFSFDGQTFFDHLRLDAAGTELASTFMTAGVIQSSENPQLPATAFVSGLRLSSEETERPPRLDSVRPPNAPLEGGIQVVIAGAGLSATLQVTLAGVPAQVLSAREDQVVVLVGPRGSPGSGDVQVVTQTGSQLLKNAFAFFGKTFIRGDVNGDGADDISDVLAGLNYLFRGGPQPGCLEAADANGDGDVDVSDSVRLLLHLFLANFPLPQPFPDRGIASSPALPCGLAPGPVLTGVSSGTIREGDVVTLTGAGFAPVAEQNLVFFGHSRAKVLQGSETRLIVQVGPVASSGRVAPAILVDSSDPDAPPYRCFDRECRSSSVGLAAEFESQSVEAVSSADLHVFGASRTIEEGRTIVLDLPRETWDPTLTYEVNASFSIPEVQLLSRGGQVTSFDFRYFTSQVTYEEWCDALARDFAYELGGGASSPELTVSVGPGGGCILFNLETGMDRFASAAWRTSWIDVLFRAPEGKCGPFSPTVNPREFGWCRFQELIERPPVSGPSFPKFELFYTKDVLLSASVLPLTPPGDRSSDDKHIMYNKAAYDFVRKEKLWCSTHLGELDKAGLSRIPRFPRSAIVVKTSFDTKESIEARMLDSGITKPPGWNIDELYYHFNDKGKEVYLIAFHMITKDVDDWFWSDFYIPTEAGGLGGGGGRKDDQPSSIPSPWRNYAMCTNLEPDDPICCNEALGECRTPTTTCTGCHRHPGGGSPGGGGSDGARYIRPDGTKGDLSLDYIFSLQWGPPTCK